MKIIGISGSPRKEGNTEILVRKALKVCLKQGAEIQFLPLSVFSIAPYGEKDYKKADFFPEIASDLKLADGIIVGSPTHFASVSGQLKILFDRTVSLRRDGYKLSGKVGGAIAVGGARNGGQEFVIQTIHNWMLIHEMLVVGDKETAHFGGIAVAQNPGDVLKDKIGLETAENLAIQIVETLKRLGK